MLSHLRLAALFALALAAAGACSGPERDAPSGPLEAEFPSADLPAVDLSAWGTERIPLPPGFAPSLPSGDELLLFAPGMFDADAADYWSYAFLIRLDEPLDGAAELDGFLEAYYDGLIGAVAEGKDGDVGVDPATVEVVAAANGGYEAEIDLIDAFVTMQPIQLRMTIAVEGERGELLRIAASPQPADHEVWRALDAAAGSLEL